LHYNNILIFFRRTLCASSIFFSLFIIVALLTGALSLLTLGCDEEKDNNSSLLILVGLGGGPKRMFLTAVTDNGNLGGIAGADAMCMNDSNKPAGGRWKAMMGSTDRSAVPLNNWVLKPNTQYTRTDGTIIGTTNNDSVFIIPVDGSITDDYQAYWTGLNSDWTNATNNCSGWTIANVDAIPIGQYGESNETNDHMLYAGGSFCGNVTFPILCVEQ
jgi:hypothetical protein